MVREFAEALMGAEADALCGADYGERPPERVKIKDGYRERRWDRSRTPEPFEAHSTREVESPSRGERQRQQQLQARDFNALPMLLSSFRHSSTQRT